MSSFEVWYAGMIKGVDGKVYYPSTSADVGMEA